MNKAIELNTYVTVTKVPDPWEGGDTPLERENLLGHCGIVVELDEPLSQSLIRFPSHKEEHRTFQRWIENTSLETTSVPKPLLDSQYEQC